MVNQKKLEVKEVASQKGKAKYLHGECTIPSFSLCAILPSFLFVSKYNKLKITLLKTF